MRNVSEVIHQQVKRVVPLVFRLVVEVVSATLDNDSSTGSYLVVLAVMDDETPTVQMDVSKVELSDCDPLSIQQCRRSFVDSLE